MEEVVEKNAELNIVIILKNEVNLSAVYHKFAQSTSLLQTYFFGVT